MLKSILCFIVRRNGKWKRKREETGKTAYGSKT